MKRQIKSIKTSVEDPFYAESVEGEYAEKCYCVIVETKSGNLYKFWQEHDGIGYVQLDLNGWENGRWEELNSLKEFVKEFLTKRKWKIRIWFLTFVIISIFAMLFIFSS